MSDADWEARAKRLLRSEMAKRGITYAGLIAKLATIGVKEEERNLRNKVARGKFSAAFMLQCLAAIGTKTITVSED